LQAAPVLVAHPTVGADERHDASGGEAAQRCLKEADVHIGSPQHGGACPAIGVVEAGGHILRSDVGRVPDDEISLRIIERAEEPLMLRLSEEVVGGADPGLGEVVGVWSSNSRVGEEFSDDLTGCGDVVRQHIGRMDRCPGGGDVPVVPAARLDQSLDHRPEERTTSARRLDRPKHGQVPVRGVSSEVQDELHDPPARKHLTMIPIPVNSQHTHDDDRRRRV
jgi:hypothetical protein